jgi:hypothetical protein
LHEIVILAEAMPSIGPGKKYETGQNETVMESNAQPLCDAFDVGDKEQEVTNRVLRRFMV